MLGVLDRRLADVDYLAVDYSIADIAVFPWVVRTEWMDLDLAAFPNVKSWYDAIAARPAVQRVLAGDVGHLRPPQPQPRRSDMSSLPVHTKDTAVPSNRS